MSKPSRKFTDCISILASGFLVQVDEPMFMAYWIALRDINQQALDHAIERAILECKSMPRPAELRELAGVMTPAQRAVLAFESVQSAVKRLGAYKSVDFDDPVINATVRNLGGWERVCELPVSEFDKFFRRDFERVYLSLCRSGITQSLAAPLMGISDRENGKAGFKQQPATKVLTGMPQQPARLLGSTQKPVALPVDIRPQLKNLKETA